jgi:hypothetical protein
MSTAPTAQKHHISLSGKPVPCGADERACPREHYASFQEAKTAQKLKVEVTAAAAEHEMKQSVAEHSDTFVHDEQYRNVKKMPALFVIDREAHVATTDINESAAWIFDEPARPTIKRDGTSVTVSEDGTIYARRMVRRGRKAPAGFIPAETDSYTGNTFGLEPVEQSGFAKMFKEASAGQTLAPGTYELCGPKINGNPESLTSHKLLSHGDDAAVEIPDMRTIPREEAFETLKGIFAGYKKRGIEGVVWWGADGKRTKLRVKDFFGDPQRK